MTNEIVNSPGINLPWAGKIVRMEEIEYVLASLWKMSADNLRIGANLGVRTSVLNLIICAPDIESARRASKILRELSSTHLARVTILILDSTHDKSNTITSWAPFPSSSIFSDLMRHCFEQTTLLVSGTALRYIANVI